MTPKTKQRAARRRVSQNKSSGSSLTYRGTMTKTWNIQSMSMPEYNNTLKRDNKVHSFIQSLDFGNVVTTSNTVPTFYSRAFTFNDVQQVTSFTSLFDQYKIDLLEIWFQPEVNLTSGAVSNPFWYSVVDYDDATTPTGLNQLQQYTNVIETTFRDGHYMRFQPHVAVAAYSGAFTSFLNQKSTWIDSASPSVQHYGIKAGMNVTPSTINLHLCVRIHFSCRNVF
jgi:hypothetical protein